MKRRDVWVVDFEDPNGSYIGGIYSTKSRAINAVHKEIKEAPFDFTWTKVPGSNEWSCMSSLYTTKMRVTKYKQDKYFV